MTLSLIFAFLKNLSLPTWGLVGSAIVIGVMYGLLQLAWNKNDGLQISIKKAEVELVVARELNATQAAEFKAAIAVQNAAVDKLVKATTAQQNNVIAAESAVRDILGQSESRIANILSSTRATSPANCTQSFDILKDVDQLTWAK